MSSTEPFALAVLVVALVGIVVVLSNRLTARLKVPSPALVLVGAAVAAKLFPHLHEIREETVVRVVSVALALVLFDGGMHIGWSRFRSALAPIVTLGVAGTVLVTAAGAILAHAALGVGWYPSLLVATALAPTDPAVVFSVLGRRELAGRAGTILEGESGANDPVGIALMASLAAAGSLSASAFGHVAGGFALQMGVGLAVGVLGGRALLWFTCRVPLPSEGLYPIRNLAGVLVIFASATLLHGSGFLAVFAAGILVGDERAPYKSDVERFHAALASLAEIVVFVLLGLTVNLDVLGRTDVWVPGVVFGAGLAFVLRPVLVGALLVPVRLDARERTFVLFAGLKGAVPILLGGYLFTAHLAAPGRLYGIVVVVVVFSVAVQGALVPGAARVLGLPMRFVEPEPWALGIRLRQEPEGVHRLTVRPGAPADGCTIRDLGGLPADAWVALLVRDGQLLAVRADTELRAGDSLTVLADPDEREALAAAFELVAPQAPPVAPGTPTIDRR